MGNVSRQSFDPLYFQIEQEILAVINQGKLQSGDRLPSESEIAQKYHVSRITARRVLDDLVKQGVAYAQQGRGTFVAMPRIREISGFTSFSDDIRARGLKPSSHVIEFSQIRPAADLQKKLHLKPGEMAYKLERIRLANDRPVAMESAYLPVPSFPNLLECDFSNHSLYAVMREKYNLFPAWADAEIFAAQATAEEANNLGMRAGFPVLVADRLTYTRTFEVVESVRSVYCGDRFSFYTGRQYIA
jgi:GntR family transcriptional regulator